MDGTLHYILVQSHTVRLFRLSVHAKVCHMFVALLIFLKVFTGSFCYVVSINTGWIQVFWHYFAVATVQKSSSLA